LGQLDVEEGPIGCCALDGNYVSNKVRGMLGAAADLLRKAPNKLTREIPKEEDGMRAAWYRGSLVWSDISRVPGQGGYQ